MVNKMISAFSIVERQEFVRDMQGLINLVTPRNREGLQTIRNRIEALLKNSPIALSINNKPMDKVFDRAIYWCQFLLDPSPLEIGEPIDEDDWRMHLDIKDLRKRLLENLLEAQIQCFPATQKSIAIVNQCDWKQAIEMSNTEGMPLELLSDHNDWNCPPLPILSVAALRANHLAIQQLVHRCDVNFHIETSFYPALPALLVAASSSEITEEQQEQTVKLLLGYKAQVTLRSRVFDTSWCLSYMDYNHVSQRAFHALLSSIEDINTTQADGILDRISMVDDFLGVNGKRKDANLWAKRFIYHGITPLLKENQKIYAATINFREKVYNREHNLRLPPCQNVQQPSKPFCDQMPESFPIEMVGLIQQYACETDRDLIERVADLCEKLAKEAEVKIDASQT